jgi:hypothetical protein
LLQRMARSWEPHERWFLLSAVVAFPPLMLTVMIGAFSLLLSVCLLQFYLTLKSAREGQSGLWMVLGTVKPQAVLLPGVLLLGARRWRVLRNALLIGGGVAVLSAVLLGWHSWLGYIRILRTHTGLFDAFGVVPTDMYNLKGTLALILGNGQATLINQISYVALTTTFVPTLLLWRGPWQPDDANFELRMALTMLLGLLFSLHLNPQDGLMLVVPAALFYAYLRQRDLPRRAYAVFALSCPSVFLISRFTVGGSLGIRVPVLAMIVLNVWMGKALYDERRTK